VYTTSINQRQNNLLIFFSSFLRAVANFRIIFAVNQDTTHNMLMVMVVGATAMVGGEKRV
jgi:hypothetical protein